MNNTVLQSKQLGVLFGKNSVLKNINFNLIQGERHALIGPNGAGKTTLINALTGILRPSSGSIYLCGSNITDLGVSQRARKGLIRTFQINSLFPKLTALQTVSLSVIERKGYGSCWWRTLSSKSSVTDEAAYWLEFIGLLAVGYKQVQQLSYGEQRLLEIVIALASKPKVLLLDEPVAGLATNSCETVTNILGSLPEDITVLLVEHDMDLVFGFANTVSVLAQGELIASGSPDVIQGHATVRSVYLGV